ncbi:MAG: hypothetical protein OXK76_07000 [Gammaproteobacteria bacterium]|nr:hypothetical protein [Gammaproteobacteria bacterium]
MGQVVLTNNGLAGVDVSTARPPGVPSSRRRTFAETAAIWLAGTALATWPAAGEASLPVVAVGEVESASALLPATTMRLAIEAALVEMPAFATMKNKDLSRVLEERGVTTAGIAQGNVALGESSGVDYLLTGRVDASVASKLSPLGSMLRVLRSGAECTAAVGLDVEVVDLGSGDIVFSERLTHRLPAKVVYPPGADYSDPCRYANRSRKWRALQAASNRVAAEFARKLTVALFPVRVVQVAETAVTLNYGKAVLSVGEVLKVFATADSDRDPAGTAEPILGYVAVSAVSPGTAAAQTIHARRGIAPGDGAAVLTKDERRQLKRMLAARARATARRERACENARKRVRRYCERDPEARRCKAARAAVAADCDA